MSEKNTLIARGFDDIEELQITQDKFGIVLIKGAAYRDNVGYKISIKRTADTWVEEHERKKRKPLYTGTISILDPASSHVMLSNAKKERKNENGKAFKNKDIYASIKFECDSADEGKIACILTRQIDTLFDGNKGQLKDAAKKMMLPDHLTPQSAAGQYSNEFLRLYYSESSSENNEERQNKIAKTLSVLPCVPICKLKAREVSAFFDDNNVTTANRELCSHFFDFLIATEKCAGKNPIITSDSKETSTNAILRAAFSQQGLGSAVFTKMFELINNRISSLYCVIVLLASGFPLQDIRNLKWKDLDFVKGFRDFVIAHIQRDYTAISKHDFSRPVIPDAALYLRKVYSSFVKERGRDKVNEEWILPRNMTNADIAEGVNNLLVRAGFSGQTVAKGRPSKSEAIPITILRTNYQHMLNTVAGLKDDPDTFSFLCGVLLKSSTYTSYESHTTPEAQFRLYTILKSISVEKKLKEKSGVEKGKDGWLYKAVPRTNHEVARVTGTIRLRPEERIIIRVPHGVTGVVEALRKEEQ